MIPPRVLFWMGLFQSTIPSAIYPSRDIDAPKSSKIDVTCMLYIQMVQNNLFTVILGQTDKLQCYAQDRYAIKILISFIRIQTYLLVSE